MAEPLPTEIEIVRAPIGEAPEWVREAWVGLALPLAWPTAARSFRCGSGVLTAPTSRVGIWWASLRGRVQDVEGYPVPSAEAIAILRRERPDAAEWWERETPRFLQAHQLFVFDTPACRPVPKP